MMQVVVTQADGYNTYYLNDILSLVISLINLLYLCFTIQIYLGNLRE